MGIRNTVSFIVKVGQPVAGKPQSYLADKPNWTLTEIEDEAAKFTLHTSPLVSDEIRIEKAEHELAGGLHDYLDLEEGVQRTWSELVRRLEAQLWPSGKPDAETPEEIGKLQEELEAAFTADTSRQKAGLTRMRAMVDRIAFLACWDHLIVDPPVGWDSLQSKALPRNVLGWIQTAHSAAQLETLEGKS